MTEFTPPPHNIDDYLHGNAAADPLMEMLHNQEVSEEAKQKIAAATNLKEKIWEILRSVYDPEIPVNIVELGLVYAVDIKENSIVSIEMTLTAPTCPVAGALPGIVEARVMEFATEVSHAHVQLVWDPPWDQSMMSEAAQLELGLL